MGKKRKPDDYNNDGFFEMARFAEQVIMRNNMSPAEFQEFKTYLADNYKKKKEEIDTKVADIQHNA